MHLTKARAITAFAGGGGENRDKNKWGGKEGVWAEKVRGVGMGTREEKIGDRRVMNFCCTKITTSLLA